MKNPFLLFQSSRKKEDLRGIKQAAHHRGEPLSGAFDELDEANFQEAEKPAKLRASSAVLPRPMRSDVAECCDALQIFFLNWHQKPVDEHKQGPPPLGKRFHYTEQFLQFFHALSSRADGRKFKPAEIQRALEYEVAHSGVKWLPTPGVVRARASSLKQHGT